MVTPYGFKSRFSHQTNKGYAFAYPLFVWCELTDAEPLQFAELDRFAKDALCIERTLSQSWVPKSRFSRSRPMPQALERAMFAKSKLAIERSEIGSTGPDFFAKSKDTGSEFSEPVSFFNINISQLRGVNPNYFIVIQETQKIINAVNIVYV